MNKEKLVSGILQSVGGWENVESAMHCMTRLRLRLKNKDLVNIDEVKKVDGVLGAQFVANEFQIIIGPSVNSVYAYLIEHTGLKGKPVVAENLDPELAARNAENSDPKLADKKKLSIKGVLGSALDALSGSMSPIVPLMVCIGAINVIQVILGPVGLKLITADSALYGNLSMITPAVMYFFPMLLAYTGARYHKVNVVLTMAIAAFLLCPDFLAIVDAGEAYTFFGLPIKLINYSRSVIPMLLVPWAQKYLEKLLHKIIPDMLKVILVPALTLLIMLPLTLTVFGPVAMLIGEGLHAIIEGLYQVAGPLETTLHGSISLFSTAFGFGRPIRLSAFFTFLETGYDYTILPQSDVVQNFVAMGATTGFLLKTRKKDNRKMAVTCLVSGALGGVSEPSIFGIFMVHRICLLTTCIGGAVSGLVRGLLNVCYYQMAGSNIMSVLAFASESDPYNLLKGIIACAVGFVVTMVLTMLLYKDKEDVAV